MLPFRERKNQKSRAVAPPEAICHTHFSLLEKPKLVVALDANTGAIVAAAFSSGSCNAASPPTQFDGTYDLERLPVGRNYNLYAEPLVDIALPSDFDVPADLCSLDVTPWCMAPTAKTNFNVRTVPTSP
jgi:hypothetical protein